MGRVASTAGAAARPADAPAPRVLLLATTRSYNAADFARAAEAMGVRVAMATDRCHVLAQDWPEGALSLDFRDPAASARAIVDHTRGCGRGARGLVPAPLAGIVPTDEVTAVIAAHAARALGLPHNPPEAARRAGNKLAFRAALTGRGLPQPRFVALRAPPAPTGEIGALVAACGQLAFPVVVKPVHLSASRGVMRADDAGQLARCIVRLADILRDPEVAARDREAARTVLVEEMVPGPEVAVEGLLVRGALGVLAIFDKPDPVDGPVFPDTIYVTPSRAPAPVADAIAGAVADAADAIGLVEGPIHAEVRLSPGGPVVLELAARSIGGLCSRALRLGAGVTLESVILCHAIGREVAPPPRVAGASGVAMLPVPARGVIRAIAGADEARAVPGVREVAITARVGDAVAPLPEAGTYLGFAFAEADTPEAATGALRAATARIRFDIAPSLNDRPAPSGEP